MNTNGFTINKVLPNPFTNYINVNYIAAAPEGVAISILNSYGKELRNIRVSASKGSNWCALENLDDLPKGIYFITAKENNLQSQTLKLIKY